MQQALQRAIVIVLDGVGVGALPDAAHYGPPDADPCANCLRNTAQSVGGLALPHLGMLGLGCITDIQGTPGEKHPTGCYGRMAEQSAGKDSTTGHWELMGIITATPLPTYPQGFPQTIITAFEDAIGRKTIGNYPASGTAIIQDLGAEHLRTGCPIVYTSADSVFQIAVHEDVATRETLYQWCTQARAILQPPHAVGRVIARPFSGSAGHFIRTPYRHDFALPPPSPTFLDALRKAGYDVIGLGKIGDLFAEQGLTASEHPSSDEATMARTLEWLDRDWRGLLFVNLVDCDTLYGHRRDPSGYAATLRAFDAWLPTLFSHLGPLDAVFITGDHGTDPTVSGTDHTREYVPLLVAGPAVRAGFDLETRSSFADLGTTIGEALGLHHQLHTGTSFWKKIQNT